MENKEKHLGSVRREEAPKSRKRDEEKEPFSWKKEILSWIQILAAAAVIAYVLTTYIIANSTVPTGSMENTIMSHSRVLGSRLTYKFSEPERGDIAIFRYPDDKEEAASARMARDPNMPTQGKSLAELGVLAEFLDGLPYKSDIMLLREEDWYRMSIGEQTAFINRLKSRLARYEEYDRDRENWESFGQSNAGDWVYRVPLSMLP